MKVVLVDDSVEIRNVLKGLLSDVPGLEIAGEAGDVPEAVELIATLRPHLVILDIGLPSGNGIEVLRRVKQMQPSPLVIILTGLRTAEYRIACENAGADYFFDKTTGLLDLQRLLTELPRRRNPGR